MTNKYAGKCAKCGQHVAAGRGKAFKSGGKWAVEHDVCPADQTVVQRAAADLVRNRVWIVMCLDPGYDHMLNVYDTEDAARTAYYDQMKRYPDLKKWNVVERMVGGELSQRVTFKCQHCGRDAEAQRGWLARAIHSKNGAMCDDCHEGWCEYMSARERGDLPSQMD